MLWVLSGDPASGVPPEWRPNPLSDHQRAAKRIPAEKRRGKTTQKKAAEELRLRSGVAPVRMAPLSPLRICARLGFFLSLPPVLAECCRGRPWLQNAHPSLAPAPSSPLQVAGSEYGSSTAPIRCELGPARQTGGRAKRCLLSSAGGNRACGKSKKRKDPPPPKMKNQYTFHSRQMH